MPGSLNPTLIVLLIGLIASPALAGGKEAWKAESHPSAAAPGPTTEPPSYCGALGSLIQKRLAKLRAINAALLKSKTAAPSSVLEFTERMAGNSYETDWQREQTATLAKGKAEAVELNERYRGQKCGSIDIEKEASRAPDPEPVKPLKMTTQKKKKFK